MYGDQQLIQQGWQCPVCKRVYSPATYVCWYCGGSGCTATTKTVTNDPEQLAEKYKKMIDDVIKSEEAGPDLYLLNMNAAFDGLMKEEHGDAGGD